MSESHTIWCNAAFNEEASEILHAELAPHHLLFASQLSLSNLVSTGHDALLEQATICFGQPDPVQVIDSPGIKWVHLTSAGYTRYDTPEFREAMRNRRGMLTSSSSVYADPCAEHAAAMVLSLARQLPQAMDDQRGQRRWPTEPLRAHSRLLSQQSMLIFGYGSIAARLVELLTPFGLKMTGVRRNARGNEKIPIVDADKADEMLAHVDHVMNILPASPATEKYFNAHRLRIMSPDALFYNIGRGSTVDQAELTRCLQDGEIAGAYLDVTTPEPLPVDHPLWKLKNCWITPHTAGGHHDEAIRLVRHFRENLRRYLAGATLLDRVI
jgi:phosphoglycerate dehydrogenase-like enzyme